MSLLSGPFPVSKRLLKFLAAFVWFGGVVALGLKAAQLLAEASNVQSGGRGVWITLLGGFVVGLLKGELLFTRSCKKNLIRIDTLVDPRWYQFFRPRFFLFLATMVILGASLSRLSHDNYMFLLVVSFVDISVAVALLVSSRCFIR